MLFKKIPISTKIQIYFCFIKNKKYILIINNNFSTYLMLDSRISFYKEDNYFLLKSSSNNCDIFYSFYNNLLNILNKLIKPIIKRLVLKGRGFKANFILNRQLQLKLGLSHTILLSIPNSLKLGLSKNKLVIKSIDVLKINDFVTKIRNFRKPDIYKGKGILYKNEKLILKPIKKT